MIMVGAAFHYYDTLDEGLGHVRYYLETIIYSLKQLGATHVFIIDTSKFKTTNRYENPDSEIEVRSYDTVTDIQNFFPDFNLVYLENWQTIEDMGVTGVRLDEFKHPEKPCYVVGPDKGAYTPDTDTLVNIPDIGNMIAEDVLKFALYDRIKKI